MHKYLDEHQLERRKEAARRNLEYYYRNRYKINARRKNRNAEWMKKWREQNPEAAKQRKREWYAKHPDSFKAWYRKNYPHHAATIKAWQKRNPDKVKQYREKSKPRIHELNQRHIETLSESYVRAKLARGTSIPAKAWPSPVVELKRATLQLQRLWRNQKT